MAVNLATDRFRWARRRLALAIRLRPVPEPDPPILDGLAVTQALRVLPRDQRAAVVLHHLLDLPVDWVVGRTTTRDGNVVEMVVWPTRDGFCLAVEEQGGGSSRCGAAGPQPGVASAGTLAPQLHCSSGWSLGAGTTRLRLALGGVPRSARTVRVEAAGARVEVPARDGGELLGRAFFLAELPARRPPWPVRATTLDATGTAVGSWRLGRCR